MKEKLPINKKDISKTFNDIAKRYDFLNHFLSIGIDSMWRKKMVTFLPFKSNLKVLDLATGTGDVAITMAKRSRNIKLIVGCDPAVKMMDIAKRKVKKEKLSHLIEFKEGNAEDLPFENNSFDAVTMAFGLRNVPNVEKGLLEIHRVLKKGGRAIILEFSIPQNRVIKIPYMVYFKHVLPIVGGVVSKNFKAYKYLNKSVEDFPEVSEIKFLMNKIGFNVKINCLTAGVATIYVLEK